MALTKVTSGVRTLGTGEVTSANLAAGAVDTTGLQDDIALLAFKTQANGSLARYNLVDQSVDAFQDATGVDASASTNENRNSAGKYWSGAPVANYFGAGVADTTYSTNTNLTVSNVQGSYDGDMVLAEYNTLTVDAGVTLSTNVPCRGLFIYVKGNCVINGTISMTAKGAYASPEDTTSPVAWGNAGSDNNTVGADGLRLGMLKTGSTETFTNDGTGFNGCGTAVRTAVGNQTNLGGDGKIYQVARQGAAGAAAVGANTAGVDAISGQSTLASGGGGSGGSSSSSSPTGAGSYGSCWGGGSGGGGIHNSTGAAADAAPWGGLGGSGNFGGSSGGAGNPGGVGNGDHGGTGETGTGGSIWLIVGGTLSGSGTVESKGKNGGPFVQNSCGGGGGSGGGAIVIASVADTSSITVTTDGGLGTVTGSSGGSTDGGDGGDGYQIKEAGLDSGDSTPLDMTLVSNTLTSVDAVTKGDVVMTISNGAGTTTVNTDVKCFISRDNGANYTETTLASQGTTGGHTILTAHDVTLGGTDTSQMLWKVTTHNQSASKTTRIQAVSLGWS